MSRSPRSRSGRHTPPRARTAALLVVAGIAVAGTSACASERDEQAAPRDGVEVLVGTIGDPTVAPDGTATSAPADDDAGEDTGGVSDETLRAYGRIEEKLLQAHPDEWGGAFLEGSTLVVTTVTRTVPEATALLSEMKLDGVEVRQVEVSLADLDAAVAALSDEEALDDALSSWGPDYMTSTLVVTLRSDANVDATMTLVNQVLTDLAAATGAPRVEAVVEGS